MAYRLSRNTEASIVDKITIDLAADGWTNIRVEKSFAEAYKGTLACIVINATERPIKRKEIGTDAIFNDINVDIRIFAKNDGQRLDLADWMLEKIMPGIVYYTYIITNGAVSSKVKSGKINVLKIIKNSKELTRTEKLEESDRYRHILSLNCRIALT